MSISGSNSIGQSRVTLEQKINTLRNELETTKMYVLDNNTDDKLIAEKLPSLPFISKIDTECCIVDEMTKEVQRINEILAGL